MRLVLTTAGDSIGLKRDLTEYAAYTWLTSLIGRDHTSYGTIHRLLFHVPTWPFTVN